MSGIAAYFRLDAQGLRIAPQVAADDAFCRRLSDAVLREQFVQMGVQGRLLAVLLDQQFEAQRTGYRQSFPEAEYFVVTERGAAVGRVVTVLEATDAGPQDRDAPSGRSPERSRTYDGLRLVDIALLPSAQGRGIGREVIGGLVRAAGKMGLRRLTLSVQPSNDRARRLYLRLGFVETGGEALREMMMPLSGSRQVA
ncbi:GNAT family N-acetyltransferase [Rhodopseudomonas sp. BR0M22]|uniref:GNAT family N-acetyltransferase n=1 Tax=Rhodopseudomonas sp. BR0M22 TaxID=2269369 RepID=UPI0013E0A8C2|nr:GNAT family N-acetyltransferase [Rhodopseudomonas sp. BR0M22]